MFQREYQDGKGEGLTYDTDSKASTNSYIQSPGTNPAKGLMRRSNFVENSPLQVYLLSKFSDWCQLARCVGRFIDEPREE